MSDADAPTDLARIIVPAPVGLLHYRIPEALQNELSPGVAVRVPLGPRATYGYVVDVGTAAPAGVELREVASLDPERPSLPPGLMELVLFAADYYGTPYGDVLAAALPPKVRASATRYRLAEPGRAAEPSGDDVPVMELAHELPRGFTVAALEKRFGWTRKSAAARLRKLEKKGWIELKTTKKRKKVGAGTQEPRNEDESGGGTPLEIPGFLASRPIPSAEPAPTLTPEQVTALDAIRAALGTFACFLLHGVTGSGKTEVYLHAIAETLERGQSGLVLVPEIALTPQLGQRFRARFGDTVAMFHSGLSPAERRREWDRVQIGEARIGLGARSALFLPLERLGLVIVDEEHEGSFKQDEAPRYNARDLAVARAKLAGAVVVLGSATPSLETRHNAAQGRYRHLVMSRRVHDRPMPRVETVRLADAERPNGGLITRRLADAIEQTLTAGEQVILFLNRRGFAPYVFCRDCGHTHRCPDCDVSLTLHRRRGALLCHYCGHEEPAPDACVSCQGHRVEPSGVGVERLDAELQDLFPKATLARLDRDSVRRQKDLERELGRFRSGEAQILLGTQMVTKGHDFPGVTLVGVVLADASLNFPDFRAAERTFQILTQVAGRAGRGNREGLVLVQGYEIDHYAVHAAARHDYEGFAAQELQARKELLYPPFSHLLLARCEGPSEPKTQAAAADLAGALRERVAKDRLQAEILGPAPAPLARLKGQWRMQVLVKSRVRSALRPLVETARRRAPAGVRQILDVDPYSML